MRPDVPSVVSYLACLSSGQAVALIDPNIPDATLAALARQYQPDIMIGPPNRFDDLEGYRSVDGTTWLRTGPGQGHDINPNLALLLTTSGSTGSPRFVRLSGRAVRSNAESIAAYLGLGAGERAVTTLPLFYTFGLSVLHSHLAAGATVVLTDQSVLRPAFWSIVAEHGCTSFAGVPYTYQMLDRLAFEPLRYPSLKTMTQAGGRLEPGLVASFGHRLAVTGGRLIVMYGQTEATARMAWLPPEHIDDKLGSVGIAVPGGRLYIVEEASAPGRSIIAAPT